MVQVKLSNKNSKSRFSRRPFIALSAVFILALTYFASAQVGEEPYIPPEECDFDRPFYKFGDPLPPILIGDIFKAPINYNLPNGFRSKLCQILKPVIPPDNTERLGIYGGKIYNGYPLIRDTISDYFNPASVYRGDSDRLKWFCGIIQRIPRRTDNGEIDYLEEIGYNPQTKGFFIENTEETQENETYGQNNYIAWINFFTKRYWLLEPSGDKVEDLGIIPSDYDPALNIKIREKLQNVENPTERQTLKEKLNFERDKLRFEVERYYDISLDVNVQEHINDILSFDCEEFNAGNFLDKLYTWQARDMTISEWTKRMYADELVDTIRRSSDILK